MYCCFTGHRPESLKVLFNKSSEEYCALKKVLSSVIDSCIDDGYTDFISGMARGIDIMAAEIVIEKKKNNPLLSLHAALPCPNQCDGWTNIEKEQFKELLSCADTKTIISPIFTSTCMLSRNRYMVDNSERVIAVWNGYFKGGTAYTVRYAKKEGKEIINIRPKDLSVTKLN